MPAAVYQVVDFYWNDDCVFSLLLEVGYSCDWNMKNVSVRGFIRCRQPPPSGIDPRWHGYFGLGTPLAVKISRRNYLATPIRQNWRIVKNVV